MRALKSSIPALIIAVMLACSSFTSSVAALDPGDLIWKKTSNPSSGNDEAHNVAVDGTGVYVVGYDSKTGTGGRWRMEKRSLTDGSLIWRKTSNPSSGYDVATGVAVESTDIYIVGYDSKPGNERWRIEKRSSTDGSIIWRKTSNPSSSDDDQAFGVAVDSTGVYIVGYDEKLGSTNKRWRIEKRSLTDGSIIWKKTSNPSSVDDEANGVAVDSTGVYVVGYDKKSGNAEWRIEKRDLSDGSIIWRKTKNPSSGFDEALGVAVDGSGVYVVGYDYKPGNYGWRMEKRDPTDGSLLWQKTSNPSSGTDAANGVAVDGTGVYIVGYDRKLVNGRWRMEKRSTTDGSLTWKKTSNPSSSGDSAHGVAVDGTGVYIVGYDMRPGGNARWRMEKRYT